MRFLDELYTLTMKPAGVSAPSLAGLIAPAAPVREREEPYKLAGREAHKLVIQVNENQVSDKKTTSHHITSHGENGSRPRGPQYLRNNTKIQLCNTQNSYIIILRTIPDAMD